MERIASRQSCFFLLDPCMLGIDLSAKTIARRVHSASDMFLASSSDNAFVCIGKLIERGIMVS